jgi:hypothetical protein
MIALVSYTPQNNMLYCISPRNPHAFIPLLEISLVPAASPPEEGLQDQRIMEVTVHALALPITILDSNRDIPAPAS